MTLDLDRRLLLKAGTLGLGALAVPGIAQIAAARGFTHGVASGEPRQRSVMLWTRYAGGGRVHWQVSPTADFRRIVAEGDAMAEAEHDYCVKPVAAGLQPGRWYFYRFRDGRGAVSATGRTRTLPDGRTARFTLGIFSCANLAFGWFNAYAHAAARGDLDLLVHLGDYYYEYHSGKYPSRSEAVAGRVLDPAHEAVALADYRLRLAAYRSDPDLQRLHASAPMVMMWDDHETANDSWSGGAENHDPAKEGPWAARKAAAQRAYREWLPVSDDAWESYEIGDLATLFRPETRLTARSRPLEFAGALRRGEDLKASLIRFRDGAWRDPERTMMGSEQEAWLAGALKRSAGQGVRWQLLAQQTVMGSWALPAEARAWLRADAPEEVRRITAVGAAAAEVGLPLNLDAWDGYPAARDRLLRSALDSGSNLLVLSGDSHNGWAFDLDLAGTAAGAEFAGSSVTSPGLEAYAPGVAPAEVVRAVRARNPALKWADLERRGYLTLTLTPKRAIGEWLSLETVRARSTRLAGRHSMSVTRGANRFA
ncbi:MAG TPA: alkaline phosphatase D family protein [Allosphingosinicella sp.]|jgi:alkaline phosphatase D|nr:alkaline phosphatase D family protein [Allosphingosinicella sp.]